MSASKRLKVLFRSRSLKFTADYFAAARPASGEIASVDWWNGDKKEICYRPGTSDKGVIYDILFKPGRKAEYWLPDELAPRVILDIGANIGATSRYLAWRYPSAEIHSFEPVPSNLALCQRNLPKTAQLHPFALGAEDGELELAISASSANFGGYSAHTMGQGDTEKVPVRKLVGGGLTEIALEKIDIIKIDTEGAEFDILRSIPSEILSRVRWIYGELHEEGIAHPKDFAVLDLLSEWFDIEVYKPMRKKNYFFDACNRSTGRQFSSFQRCR